MILDEPLRKLTCEACGALIGANSRSVQPYRRSDGRALGDILRHARIAEGIKHQIERLGLSGPVLEVGAASFETAIQLANLRPDLLVVAIEPEPESLPSETTIEMHFGTFEEMNFTELFGVIYSNHVLEHVPQTSNFLGRIAGALATDGVALVVCPCGLRPSHELLFSDHHYHFTPRAIALAAADAGLALLQSMPCPWEPLSRLFVFARGAGLIPAAPPDLMDARRSYLSIWAETDSRLLPLLGEAPLLFGAGEFSQLIRAYLPGVFDRIEAILVDDLRGARAFPKPLLLLSDIDLRRRTILIGVRPEAVPAVWGRLEALGAGQLLAVPIG